MVFVEAPPNHADDANAETEGPAEEHERERRRMAAPHVKVDDAGAVYPPDDK